MNISELRTYISKIDSELIRLLDARMSLTKDVAEYKQKHNLPIIDEAREREILKDIPEAYRNLWDLIMDISKNEQFKTLGNLGTGKVAIQGGKGSFNEIAIQKHQKETGNSLEIVYAYTTKEVLKFVARGEVEYGQFAIANSIGGLVFETLESLGLKYWEYITHYAIPIKHCLMIHPDTTKDHITTIMGHEQAIRQCEQNLEKHFPNIKKIGGTREFTDNASIAEGIANGKLPITTASIGHNSLAEIYGLTVLEQDIQDRDDNMTTFVLIKKH